MIGFVATLNYKARILAILLAFGIHLVSCTTPQNEKQILQKPRQSFDALIGTKVSSEDSIKFDRERMSAFAPNDDFSGLSGKASNLVEGYWRRKPEGDPNDYPWPLSHPSAFVSKTQFLSKLDVLQKLVPATGNKSYLKDGAIVNHNETLGYVPCFIGDLKNNGGGDFFILFDDHAVFWPTGYRHYIAEHNVIPSREFYRLIMNLDVALGAI